MIPFRRSALAGLAGLATAAALTAAPVAAMNTADPDTADAMLAATALTATATDVVDDGEVSLPPRLERACLRIPNLELRTERLMNRLDGDGSTIGSLSWLAGRIDAARDAGRDQVATVLENRLAVRTKTREILDLRIDELARLEERCIEVGVDL